MSPPIVPECFSGYLSGIDWTEMSFESSVCLGRCVFPTLPCRVDGAVAGGRDREAQVIVYREIDTGQGLISWPELSLVHYHR